MLKGTGVAPVLFSLLSRVVETGRHIQRWRATKQDGSTTRTEMMLSTLWGLWGEHVTQPVETPRLGEF